MPLFHCTKCHHEWEYYGTVSICNWCRAVGYIIEEETSFEKFCKVLKSYEKLGNLGDFLSGKEKD